jgi:hypothetical protein
MARSLQLTIKAPVTMTTMPPFSPEGCASVVSTRCCTFWNVKLYEGIEISAFLNKQLFLYPMRLSHTESFSTIEATPWNGCASKVSIDLSRCA